MENIIDANKLKAEIERLDKKNKELLKSDGSIGKEFLFGIGAGYADIIKIIDSLQQDEKIIELEMCSQAYWEERGWMMIPPNVTLKGIESLLEQIRKSLQQEQPEVDLVKEYDEQFYSDPVFGKLVNRNAGIGIARHFYQLGLNARK